MESSVLSAALRRILHVRSIKSFSVKAAVPMDISLRDISADMQSVLSNDFNRANLLDSSGTYVQEFREELPIKPVKMRRPQNPCYA